MKKTTKSTTFTESNLSFSFDHHWTIYKFDHHRFYKQLAGRHVKGVDFIGIYQGKTLVLMEVKNYIDRYFKDGKNPSEDFFANQTVYLHSIAKKYVDSVRVIEAVNQAYQRKWWYRFGEKTWFRWMKMERLPNWEFVFWTRAWQLVQAKELRLVLWLEIEKREEVILEMVDEELMLTVEIMNKAEHDFKDSLEVISL